MSQPEEGGNCPENCGGALHYPSVKNCRCHISPPCSACTDGVLTCNECGWEDERPASPPSPVTAPPLRQLERPIYDLGDGKRLAECTYDGRSGSTMVWTGRYEGPVTPKDILDHFGTGTFGHRGPSLFGDSRGGRFTFTKITD